MQAGASQPGSGYVGRFAPSPTGLLHAGSLVAAMASYLDARAHDGRWLVRMEDVDLSRTAPGAAESILQTLAAFGMHADDEVLWQHARSTLYAAALQKLGGEVYPCGCSRREIADSIGPAISAALAQPYPGTCRHGMAPGKAARAWRIRVPCIGEQDECIRFVDRACGPNTQHLSSGTGDFVLLRGDGFWAYQLAVVVDDAAQGVTHVVRGMDLLDSTPRQIYLQRRLGLPTPHYLHIPVVLDAHGRKLSKQDNAPALELGSVVEQLSIAARVLGLEINRSESVAQFWQKALPMWAARYLPHPP